MNIIEALNIFNIDDIMNIDEDALKKKYKKLMIQNHPDLGGNTAKASNINNAYSEIMAAIKTLKSFDGVTSKNEETFIIDLNSLLDIFINNKEIVINSKNGNILLNKSNINRYNIVIEIKVDVEYNGLSHTYSKFEIRNRFDEYTIQCKYIVSSLYDVIHTRIRAYGKNISIDLDKIQYNINLNYDNAVKLKVMLERQLNKDAK